MGYEVLKEELPEYAKDIKLNLSSMVNTSKLTEQAVVGCDSRYGYCLAECEGDCGAFRRG